MTTAANTPVEGPRTAERLRVDLLYLDLTTCTRCRGADRGLDAALEAVRDVLAAAGTELELNKIHVESAAQARQLRFLSSPTIRVNGRDIALELRESSCGCEACTDGGGGSIACRVWVHRGEEYTEPPVALIVDALLREVYGGASVERDPDQGPYELPENLERFFAGRDRPAASPSPAEAAAATLGQAHCCAPAEQRSCCDPQDKAECCGAANRGSCGCQERRKRRPPPLAQKE